MKELIFCIPTGLRPFRTARGQDAYRLDIRRAVDARHGVPVFEDDSIFYFEPRTGSGACNMYGKVASGTYLDRPCILNYRQGSGDMKFGQSAPCTYGLLRTYHCLAYGITDDMTELCEEALEAMVARRQLPELGTDFSSPDDVRKALDLVASVDSPEARAAERALSSIYVREQNAYIGYAGTVTRKDWGMISDAPVKNYRTGKTKTVRFLYSGRILDRIGAFPVERQKCVMFGCETGRTGDGTEYTYGTRIINITA